MCDMKIANMASTALQIGGSVLKHVQGNKQADQSNAAVGADYSNRMTALADQQTQANAAMTDEMGQRAQQARAQRARLRAAGAESGLSGASMDKIVGESYASEGTDMATLEANRTNTNTQYGRERQSATAQAQSKLNQIAGSRPSVIGTGLEIAGAGVGYADRQIRYKAAQKKA